MASLFSDYNDENEVRYYGSAALTSERSTIMNIWIVAKGNVFAGIEAKE